MRAEKLTMQAFGCYLEETALELSLLADRLFLITGSTGGGKTTLLDAICFALYCRATGGRRTWTDMRSISAPVETPTFVEYIFSLGKERYRFRRSLRMHKVRGSGRLEARDEHACYRWKEETWELLVSGSETRVREYAQNLLGLTCEQFSQVIVLPQGEFRKLLLSNTSEKARIFQTLFQTERWDRIARAAQKEEEGLRRQLDALFQNQAALFAREGVQNLPQLMEKQVLCEEEYKQAEQMAAELETAMKKAGEAYSTARQLENQLQRRSALQQKRMSLLDKRKEMEALELRLEQARRANRCLPYLEQVERAKKLFTAKKEAVLSTEKRAERFRRELEEVETLAAMTDRQARARSMADRFDGVRAIAEKSERLQKALLQAQTDFQKAEKSVADGEAYIQGIHREAEQLPAWSEEVARLEAARQAYVLLSKREAEESKAQAQWEQAAGQAKAARMEADALSYRLERAETLVRADMAASLAHSLQPGTPCPVCGSLEHPHPAQGGEEAPGREALESLRKAADQAREKAAACQAALSACKAALEGKKDLRQEQAELCKAFQLTKEQVESELSKVKKRLEDSRRKQEKLPRAQDLLQQRKREREQARAKQEECRLGLQTLTAEFDAAIQKVQADARQRFALAESALTAARREAEEAEQRRKEARHNLEEICQKVQLPFDSDMLSLSLPEEKLIRLEESLKAYQTDWRLTEQELNELEEALRGKEAPKTEEKKAAYETALRQSREAASRQGRLRQQYDTLFAEVEQCQKEKTQSEQLQARFSSCARLSKLLSGDNVSKVPLQMFVLGIMLDDILARANVYLSTLSSGRYHLIRPEETGGGRGYNGLEILVFDGYCGGNRPVDTLSGGELFLASLSLAFGLSDVVQGYSGGVRLDSLFIDEGFGTLDQQTLDTAMKALDEIQRSGRTVGIISHVSELKKRIGYQIVVETAPNGESTARIEA